MGSGYVLLLATFAAVGLVIASILPESASPTLFRQTVFKSNLTVVCLRNGCGCDKRPITWVENAVKQRKPVLVLVDAGRVSKDEEQSFRKALASPGTGFYRTRSSLLLNRYAPSGKTTFTLATFGMITTQSTEADTASWQTKGDTR